MADPIDVPVEKDRHPAEAPESYFVPATDVYETADELVLVAEMPGVRQDGLEVTVEDNVLVIRGKPRPESQGGGDVLLQEFTAGEFYRAFQLPADYETAKIQAALKHGVLTLSLPKSDRLKPRRIEVTVE